MNMYSMNLSSGKNGKFGEALRKTYCNHTYFPYFLFKCNLPKVNNYIGLMIINVLFSIFRVMKFRLSKDAVNPICPNNILFVYCRSCFPSTFPPAFQMAIIGQQFAILFKMDTDTFKFHSTDGTILYSINSTTVYGNQDINDAFDDVPKGLGLISTHFNFAQSLFLSK